MKKKRLHVALLMSMCLLLSACKNPKRVTVATLPPAQTAWTSPYAVKVVESGVYLINSNYYVTSTMTDSTLLKVEREQNGSLWVDYTEVKKHFSTDGSDGMHSERLGYGRVRVREVK